MNSRGNRLIQVHLEKWLLSKVTAVVAVVVAIYLLIYLLLLCVCNTHRLRELPASADVNDGLDDAVTVVMNEAQWSTLVGNSQRELVVINQAHLHTHPPHTPYYC